MTTIINNQNEKEKRRLLRKAQTPEENQIWFLLRNNKTGVKWRRQVSIGRYITDFYCREKQLAIELDGAQHEEAREYDHERDKYFENAGIRTIRFSNYQIRSHPELVSEEIMKAIKEQSSHDPLKVSYKR
jgi:very-short-patch-repair endonuclease